MSMPPGYGQPPSYPYGPPPQPPKKRHRFRNFVVFPVIAVVVLIVIIIAATSSSPKPLPKAAPAATQTQAASTPSAAAPSSSGPGDEPVGGGFEVTGLNSDGNQTVYDVTLDKVDQDAPLAAYETMNNPGDHLAAAEFTIKGVTGQSSDDANNDAAAIGDDTTEYQFSDISAAGLSGFNSGLWSAGPGQTVTGWVTFEVPEHRTVKHIQWSQDLGSDTATWDLGS
jgi:hypothetical protein